MIYFSPCFLLLKKYTVLIFCCKKNWNFFLSVEPAYFSINKSRLDSKVCFVLRLNVHCAKQYKSFHTD